MRALLTPCEPYTTMIGTLLKSLTLNVPTFFQVIADSSSISY